MAFLKGNLKRDALPIELRKSAEGLQRELKGIKKNFSDLLPEKDLKDFILKNLNTYMRQSFAIFTNPSYQPKKEVYDGAVNWIQKNVVEKNKDLK